MVQRYNILGRYTNQYLCLCSRAWSVEVSHGKIRVRQKKRQRDFLWAVEPVSELQQQEYLTFSKAAILLGCTRQYVYKLVEHGKLPASRLSSRMALVRRSDIEKMFEDNPYNRVLPCTKPKKSVSKKIKNSAKDKAKEERATDEVL